jgi:hypothetical protein
VTTTNSDQLTRSPTANAPRLSLVLCSRNDNFQGNSLWRLETTLNHAARQADRLGRLDDIELVVADWGSDEPLREAVRLTDEASRVVRFLTVPPKLAKEKQGDSPFAEVIAINAAARRSRGEYIGRIDQDTLVGRKFLEWFFSADEGCDEAGFPLGSSVMISNRRRIPYDFASRCPSFPVVERYVSAFGSHLPVMGGSGTQYWEVYIGILLFHRRLWEECGGYDETFLYYSFMEFDLFLRLRMRYEGVDLGPAVGHDFLHLDHMPAWLSWEAQPRRNNAVIRTLEAPPPVFCPTGPDWGLARYDLPLESASAGRGRSDARWRTSCWPELIRATASSTVRTVARVAGETGRSHAGRTRAAGIWRRLTSAGG